jgi:tRNA(His) guanylyltransferase
VKNFEQDDRLLPNTWIVIRIDGRGFHKYVQMPESRNMLIACRFSDKNEFEKPNDKRALDLMNAAAMWTMEDLTDIVMGYGVSDEYR